MSEIPEISSLETHLRNAAKEVLETALSVSPEFTEPGMPPKGMSAIIGIGDGISGFLAVHVSHEHACKIAGVMLGDTYPEVDDIVCDAIGELANMLGGSLKKFSSFQGVSFKISVPTIVLGKDYETHAAKASGQVLLGVSGGPLRFTMQLVVYSH